MRWSIHLLWLLLPLRDRVTLLMGWLALVLRRDCCTRVEQVVVCDVSLRRLRPSTLIYLWRRCVLNLLLLLPIEFVASPVGHVSFVFKELLLGRSSVILGALPSILCIRWLHELFPSIRQVLMGRCSALIHSSD